MSDDDLNRANWVTPTAATDWPPVVVPRHTVQWSVLLRTWGDRHVYSCGPFDSWGEAEEWADGMVINREAEILGFAEYRRPGGGEMAPRKKPRGPYPPRR